MSQRFNVLDKSLRHRTALCYTFDMCSPSEYRKVSGGVLFFGDMYKPIPYVRNICVLLLSNIIHRLG